MIPKTAYVLGNGPTLPAQLLHRLRNAFTVGVNRVLLSGFEPTAIFFADSLILQDQHDAFKKSKSLVLGAQEHRLASAWDGIVWVPTWRQRWEPMPEPDRRVFKVRGNSAAAVALWLVALGVERVQMLGCGGVVVDGRSHFYGQHPDKITEMRYQCQKDHPRTLQMHIDALLARYPDIVTVDDSVPEKAPHDVDDQDSLRTYLRGVVMGVL